MAAVITGGAISGTATLSAVILRDRLAARQVAQGRDVELRGLARTAGLQLHQAEAFFNTSAENRRLFHDIRRLPTADTLSAHIQPLAAHLDPTSWRRVRTAIATLIGAESLRDEEPMRPLPEEEVRDFRAYASSCKDARVLLDAFADGS